MIDGLIAIAAAMAGAVAFISGFGIGSILTPFLAWFIGTKLAVAVVSVPHFIGTALRFALLRQHLDRRVLVTFGVASALGGLAGALLQNMLHSAVLGYLLGALLIFAGIAGATGFAERMKLAPPAGWFAGVLSGLFGGLVGNQGGIRSAALLGFKVSKEAFVATATAVALLIDVVRIPVYAIGQYQQILSAWRPMVFATIGVLVGTLLGKPLLQRIPERQFRQVVSLIILALGIWMIFHPGNGM